MKDEKEGILFQQRWKGRKSLQQQFQDNELEHYHQYKSILKNSTLHTQTTFSLPLKPPNFSYFHFNLSHISIFVSFTSLPGSLGSTSKTIKFLKFIRHMMCTFSHYTPLLRSALKSRIRKVPSKLSLKNQELGPTNSKANSKAFLWLVWMPVTPLLTWVKTTLPPLKLHIPWCSFCMRRFFWINQESGSNPIARGL